MSVFPLSQSLGRQHLYTNSIPAKDATLCNVILVGPSVATLVHCIGDVVLVHESPLGNIHPPSLVPSSAASCPHDIGLTSKSLGLK